MECSKKFYALISTFVLILISTALDVSPALAMDYQITGPGAVVATQSGIFHDFLGRDVGGFRAGEQLCVTAATLGSAGSVSFFGKAKGITVDFKNLPGYFKPAPDAHACSGFMPVPQIASAQQTMNFYFGTETDWGPYLLFGSFFIVGVILKGFGRSLAGHSEDESSAQTFGGKAFGIGLSIIGVIVGLGGFFGAFVYSAGHH